MQTAIVVMQILCLVLVIVAIVNVLRALRNVKDAQNNLEKITEYQRKMRKETDAKFDKIELDIAAIRVRKSGSGKRRQES